MDVKFSIADYEKMRNQWGKFVYSYEDKDEVVGILGVTFQDNKVIVGYKRPDDSWDDKNSLTKTLPPAFAQYEARFVQEINDLIQKLIK